MRITNRYNLPVVPEVPKKPVPNRYGVTDMLMPRHMYNLICEHWDDIEEDVSAQMWMMLGSATHKLFEVQTGGGIAERKIERLYRGVTIVGVVDNYNPDTFVLTDYKITNVRKRDTDEWRMQGLIYAWLLYPQYVDRLNFVALMRDWTAYNSEHDTPVWVWDYKVLAGDIAEAQAYIDAWLDNTAPCTAEERWNEGDTWWLYKDGGKRATRQCAVDTVAPVGYHVERRVGIDKRCERYCKVARWCQERR